MKDFSKHESNPFTQLRVIQLQLMQIADVYIINLSSSTIDARSTIVVIH